MRTVELIPASVWTCDECGRDNFVRHRVIEPESIEGTEIADEIGEDGRYLAREMGVGVGGHFLTTPTEVKCDHCGAEFAVAIED